MSSAMMRPSLEKPTFIRPSRLGRARPMKVSSSRLIRIITGALAFFDKSAGIIRDTPAVILLPKPPPVYSLIRPPRAVAGQPPSPHRADERAALLAAGHAGDLLRRRDRHGRQRLPGRSRQRANSHAMEQRPQRGLLDRGPRAAVPARRDRSRAPLRGRQRLGTAGQPTFAAVVEQAADRASQAPSGVRSRRPPDPPSGQPPRPLLRPLPGRRNDPGDSEPVALLPTRRAGPRSEERR